MRLGVVLPTTGAALWVERLAPRPGLPASVAFGAGDYRPLAFSDDYARLLGPAGPVARALGEPPPPHELRLSGAFDGGRSWEAPVALAHLLLARGHAVAARPEEAELVVWATGAVDLDGRLVEGDYALALKVAASEAMLRAAGEVPAVVALPPGPGHAEAADALRRMPRASPLTVVEAATIEDAAAAVAASVEAPPTTLRRGRPYAAAALVVALGAGLAAATLAPPREAAPGYPVAADDADPSGADGPTLDAGATVVGRAGEGSTRPGAAAGPAREGDAPLDPAGDRSPSAAAPSGGSDPPDRDAVSAGPPNGGAAEADPATDRSASDRDRSTAAAEAPDGTATGDGPDMAGSAGPDEPPTAPIPRRDPIAEAEPDGTTPATTPAGTAGDAPEWTPERDGPTAPATDAPKRAAARDAADDGAAPAEGESEADGPSANASPGGLGGAVGAGGTPAEAAPEGVADAATALFRLLEIRAAPGANCRGALFDPARRVLRPVATRPDGTFEPSSPDPGLCGMAVEPTGAEPLSVTVRSDPEAAFLPPAADPEGRRLMFFRGAVARNLVYEAQVMGGPGGGVAGAVRHEIVTRGADNAGTAGTAPRQP